MNWPAEWILYDNTAGGVKVSVGLKSERNGPHDCHMLMPRLLWVLHLTMRIQRHFHRRDAES